MKAKNKVWLVVVLVVSLIPCHAEVKFDNSLGGQVTPDSLSGKFEIPAERGELQGANLFHSFETFSVNQGEAVTFTGPENVQNILSRVTGSEISNIDGLLRSTIPGADLYLMNPQGVVFGENAKLDVQGSFHVGTADYIKLSDGVQFAADQSPSGSSLTAAAPTAFGFLGQENGEIKISGSDLRVPMNKSLSFIGSSEFLVMVRMQNGILDAPEGNITFAQIKPDKEFSIPDSTETFQPSHTSDRDVPEQSVVDEIFIRAGNLTVDGSARVGEEGVQNIAIQVEQLKLQNGGGITASSSRGMSGDISIDATDSVSIISNGFFESSLIDATAANDGAGRIAINTPDLRMDGGAILSFILSSPSSTSVDPKAIGNIDINVNNLFLSNAIIGTPGVSNQPAGTIDINATESVNISNDTKIISTTSGISQAGGVSIDSPVINLIDKANISTNSTGMGDAGAVRLISNSLILSRESQITSKTSGPGLGGNINIVANKRILMNEQSEISATTSGIGQGGKVDLHTTQFTISKRSSISASSETRGLNGAAIQDQAQAGDISISFTDYLRLKNGSKINVETDAADAGSIMLVGGDLLLDDHANISSSVAKGARGGGEIEIRSGLLKLDNSSHIEANAAKGKGGTININSDFFFGLRENLTAHAKNPVGIDGIVNINAPDSNIISGVISLPESYLNVTQLLSQRCANRIANKNSFIVRAKQELPNPPDSLLPIRLEDVIEGYLSIEDEFSQGKKGNSEGLNVPKDYSTCR